MTPPLATRHQNVRLRSPASSPNLVLRSAFPSPPAIFIEESVSDSPYSNSDLLESDFEIEPSDGSASHLTASTEASSERTNELKVRELPPINTWVPKGESLFTSILDSRSPQVYRRTAPSFSKTCSFPPASPSNIQNSRVSWPDDFQKTSPDKMCNTDIPAMITPETGCPKTSSAARSPKLLKKCTSFDIERSKPFPLRSLMTSPMMLRKGQSFEESAAASPALDLSKRYSSDVSDHSVETDRIVHFEEDETYDKLSESNTPQCITITDEQTTDAACDTIAGDNAVKYLVISSAGEFDSANGSEIATESDERAIFCEAKKPQFMLEFTEEPKKLPNVAEEIDGNKAAVSREEVKDTGAKPKQFQQNLSKSKTGSPVTAVKRKLREVREGRSQSSKTSGNSSSLKQSVKSASSEKSHSKNPVKSALLSSAAKLKAIGKKSPVTLLSYKSHSISIPDHSHKHGRPVSAHELTDSIVGKPTSARVHQTESSPTVLVSREFLESSETDVTECWKKPRSATPPVKRTEQMNPPRTGTGLADRRAGKSGLTAKKTDKSGPLVSSKGKTSPVHTGEQMPGSDKKLEKREKKSETGKPVQLTVQGVKKSAKPSELSTVKKRSDLKTRSSTSPVPAENKLDKKEILVDTSKTAPTKQVKGLQAKTSKSSKKDQQQKVSQASKAPRLVAESSGSNKIKKMNVNPSSRNSDIGEIQKHHQSKRGSVSSVNSESSRTSDHYRDCCHSRKRADKR